MCRAMSNIAARSDTWSRQLVNTGELLLRVIEVGGEYIRTNDLGIHWKASEVSCPRGETLRLVTSKSQTPVLLGFICARTVTFYTL